jgi:phosphoribosylaminoimidazole-succinocarboxamide synthase
MVIKKEALYAGKAKTIYRTDDETKLIAEFRDSLTAFDGEKKSSLEGKGYYNAAISAHLFKLLEDAGIPTHFKGMVSDIEMLIDAVEIIPIEVIVRNIAAGSITKKYPIKEGTRFVPPVIMLDYKSDEYGDPMINEDIALAMKLASREELETMRRLALEVNRVLREYLEMRDLLLVDFKLEFGRLPEGKIVVADEISADTCRFWDKHTGRSLDKDVFRFDKGDVGAVYREAAMRIVPELSQHR